MMTTKLPRFFFDSVSDQIENIPENLRELLKVARTHLGMDVSFISEFASGQRVFRFVDSAKHKNAPTIGNGDPLDKTYCKKIVDNELDGIIPDTACNRITRDMDVTDQLSIGSYLGVPINLPEGNLYGTFCCYKDKPDLSLQERDLSLLHAFADLAGKMIFNQLQHENELFNIQEQVEAVLDAKVLTIHYQPIYSLRDKRVIGYESLARFDTTPYRTPDIWFAEAASAGLGEKLEIMAIRTALEGMADLPEDIYLSVNISPEYILNRSMLPVLANVPSGRLILEITEHAPVVDYVAFRSALQELRSKGIRLAVDDAGAGYASLQHILELGAEFIKLDISLIRNIHRDPRRQALAAALIAFTLETGSEVIAEGVESSGELEELERLGVEKVQGYYIGRPQPLQEVLHSCRRLHS